MSNLKSLRKSKRMTQAELADIMGTSKGYVSHWETGRERPADHHLEKLCEIFNCNIGGLGLTERKLDAAKEEAFDIKAMNIFLLLNKKCISVKQLAEKVGCSRQYISNYFFEKGMLSEEMFNSIAKVLLHQNATMKDLEGQPKYINIPAQKNRDNAEFQKWSWDILFDIKFKNRQSQIEMFPYVYDLIEQFFNSSFDKERIEKEILECEIKSNFLKKSKLFIKKKSNNPSL